MPATTTAAGATTEATDAGGRRPSLRLRPPGIRLRILGWYVPLLCLVVGGAVLIEREILLSRVERRIDLELDGRARRVERTATGDGAGTGAEALFDRYLARATPDTTDLALLVRDGRAVRWSGGASLVDDEVRAVVRRVAGEDLPARGTVETGASTVRFLAVPVVEPGGRAAFVVAVDATTAFADIGDAVRVVAVLSLSVIAVTTALAWLVAGRALAPVRTMTDTARRIGGRDLGERIEVPPGDDELVELAGTFNDMLDRLESAFRHNREFLNDVSHELRTPITIVRGNLEVMGDDPEDRRETVALVTAELDRMARLVEDLLLLARAQQRSELDRRPVRVDDVAREVYAKVQALAPRNWVIDAQEAEVVGDRDRLVQAVTNLAANAAGHTTDGGTIEIGVRQQAGEARVWVRDDGPGVPPEARERIFERFARLNGTRREGTGLGLAIVRAVAEGHGGRVDLTSEPGEGATFTLVIPAAPS